MCVSIPFRSGQRCNSAFAQKAALRSCVSQSPLDRVRGVTSQKSLRKSWNKIQMSQSPLDRVRGVTSINLAGKYLRGYCRSQSPLDRVRGVTAMISCQIPIKSIF